MGGGGGSTGSLGDIRRLEEQAKEMLRQGATGRRNVFISFAFEDLNEVNLLRGQAKSERSELEFNDRSVHEPYKSERAEYIRQRLAERINQCSVTVVYLTENTPASEWVSWEVRKSIELAKEVVAVHKGERPPSPLPDFIKEFGIRVVPWSRLAEELTK